MLQGAASVEEALRAVYDSSSAGPVRLEAQKVLDEFARRKEAVRDGLLLYASACQDGKSDSVRMFALGSCERALRTHWGALSEDEKAQVKSSALDLLENGTRSADVEARFIRNKVVSIVVEVAKREWPQRWAEFWPRMQEIAMRGMSQAALVMGVVRDLSEDCTNSEFNNALPPRRRTDILTELRKSLDGLVQLSYKLLETCFVQVRDGTAQAASAVALAEATMGALESLSELCPLQSLIESNVAAAISEFATPFTGLPDGQRLRVAAWRCLRAYARKAVPERSTIDVMHWVTSLLVPLTRDGQAPPLRALVAHASTVESVWPTYALGNDNLNAASELLRHYEVHKVMALVASSLCYNFSQLLIESANKRHAAEPRALEALRTLLDVTLRFLCHPSHQIRASVLHGVQALVRAMPAQKDEVRGPGDQLCLEATGLLLRCLSDHVLELGHPNSPCTAAWPTSTFSVDEYDDELEFQAALGSMCTVAGSVIKTLASKRYLESVTFWRKRVLLACSRPTVVPEVPGGGLALGLCAQPALTAELAEANQQAEVPILSPAQAYLKSTLTTLTDAVASALPRGVFLAFGRRSQRSGPAETPQDMAAEELATTLRALLEFGVSEGHEWASCVQAFSRLSGCYGAPPDGPNTWLGPVLEKLFTCATFRTAAEQSRNVQGSDLSVDTLLTRKRGCMALVEICTQLSSGAASSAEIRARLAELLPTFCNQVLSAMNDKSNATLPYEKLLLYEVLVLVSNTLEDGEAQSQFVREIVSAPLGEWSSPAVAALCQDPSAFAQALLDSPTGKNRALVDAKRSLALVLSIARKSRAIGHQRRPFAPYWAQVLPNVLAMAKVLHFISGDRERFRELLYIHPEELRCLIGQPRRRNRGMAGSVAGGSSFGGGGSGGIGVAGAVPGGQALQGFSQSSTLWMDTPADGAGAEQGSEDHTRYLLHLVSGLRESLYSALGSAARYGDAGLFAIPDALQRVHSELLADVGAIEHRHLARLLQSFYVPFTQSCPKQLWSSVLFPLLGPVLGHTFQRLQAAWALLPTAGAQSKKGSRTASSRTPPDQLRWEPLVWRPLEEAGEHGEENGSPDGGTCSGPPCGNCARCQQSEVARDASIRLLGSSFVDLVSTALNTTPDTKTDPHDLQPSELCSAVLKTDELAAATLLSMAGAIASTDGLAIHKAASLFRRIFFCCLLAEERFHSFVANQLFCTCFVTLFSPRTTLSDASTHNLLQIITHIWVFALQGRADIPRDGQLMRPSPVTPWRDTLRAALLQGVPNLGEADVVAMEEVLLKQSTEKSRRARVKEFIQTCISERAAGDANTVAVESDSVFGDSNRERQVQDLPPFPAAHSGRVLPRRGKSFDLESSSWVNAANAWDLGVQALFAAEDQQHQQQRQ